MMDNHNLVLSILYKEINNQNDKKSGSRNLKNIVIDVLFLYKKNSYL